MNKCLNNKGFTLVELAVSLVVIGLLVGLGTAMVGPLMAAIKVRESKENLGGAVESINSWASGNNRLPQWGDGVADATTDEFIEVARNTTDAWGRPFIYLYDANLFNATPTKDTICGRRTTPISLTDSNTGTTIQNVAYIVFSQGDNAATDSKIGAAAVTSQPVSAATIVAANTTDDIVRWVTLDELRTKVGCQGAQLRIVNNELPYLVSGSDSAVAYNATISADGGVLASGYRWCVQGTAIPGLTFSPNIFFVDCMAQRQVNETNWLSATSLTITRAPVTAPNPPYQAVTANSYSFTIYVSDNSDTGSNDNIASKAFVLTVNP